MGQLGSAKSPFWRSAQGNDFDKERGGGSGATRDQEPKERATHIPVFPRPKVLLSSLNIAQAPTKLVDALLQAARVFRQSDRLGRCDWSRFTFHHDIKVDQLLREGRHVVGETERVLSHLVGGKDVVPLPFLLSFNHDRVRGVRHRPINIEGATGLNLQQGVSVPLISTGLKYGSIQSTAKPPPKLTAK